MKSAKNPRRCGRLAWPLVVAIVLAIGCQAPMRVGPPETEQRSESRVIKIATQSPLSGGQERIGAAITLGAKLAIEELKSLIQDAGFRLEFLTFDDEANPRVAVTNAKKIVADPDILVVIGHLNSSASLCASEIYNEAMLAMISPASTHPFVTSRKFPNVNRVMGQDDVQGYLGAVFAKEALTVKSAYVVHDKLLYGQGTAESFREGAKQHGIEIMGFEGVDERADFGQIITRIKAKNPDLIYFGGIYVQAGVFFRQVRRAGVRSMFLGPDGLDSSVLAEVAGESVVGLHFTALTVPPAAYPGANRFVSEFRRRFGKNPEPFALEAYDATLVGLKAIEGAIRQVGELRPTRQEVTAAIRRLQVEGVTGSLAFDEKGDRRRARYFVLRVESPDPALWHEKRAVVKVFEADPPPTRSWRIPLC